MLIADEIVCLSQSSGLSLHVHSLQTLGSVLRREIAGKRQG